MGSVFVEDPTIGNMLARTFGQSDPAGSYLKGLQARQLLDQQKAADDYIAANQSRWPTQAPSVPLPSGYAGPPSPPTAEEQRVYDNERRLQLATSAMGARHVTSMGDVAVNAPKLYGQTSVALEGLPQTTEGMVKLNTQLSGALPTQMFDPTKNQLTPALAQTRMRTYEDKVATNAPTTDAENRQYASDLDFVNGIKPKVGENQTSFAREQLLSAAQQQALKRAQQTQQVGQPSVAPTDAPQPGQRPVGTDPAPLAPAPVSGTGAGVTTQTEGPRPPPQVGDVINGFRYMGGNPNDKNSYAPAQPGAPTAPAAAPAPGTRTVMGPDGQPITIQQTGDPKASTETQAKLGIAVPLAQEARQRIEGLVGLKRGPDGKPLPLTPRDQGGYYVPTGPASFVSRNFGGSEAGQSLAQTLDKMGQPAGVESKMQDYAQATDQWIEQVVRLVSGATVLPSERSNYRAMFMPNAQDSPELVTRKLEAMRIWEVAAANSINAGDMLNKMKQVTAGEPVMRIQINALEEKLRQNPSYASQPFAR